MISVPSIPRNFAAVVLLAFFLAAPVSVAGGKLDEAVSLYDAGRYAEALPLLEKIVAGGDADGITYYRLYFCQRAAGDPRNAATLAAARDRLEKELDRAGDFEVAFYLSNAYTNLGQADQVSRLAAETISRYESGAIPEPLSPVEQFRLGKLYADQVRDLEAAPWLAKAVDGFVAGAQVEFRPYLAWAARWIGQKAMRQERFEEAAEHYALVSEFGTPTLTELDSLGLAALMVGQYSRAAEAWRAAVRLNPGDADNYRYCAGLADLARTVADIPISPDGDRGWEEASRQELEELLRAQAQKVRDTRAAIAAAEPLTSEQHRAFSEQLAAARPLFVGAAREYVRRGLSLRESAFFGGYAPLIFKAREWEIARAPRKKWSAQEVAQERERLARAGKGKTGNSDPPQP